MLTTKLELGAMLILLLGCAVTAARLPSPQAPPQKQSDGKAKAAAPLPQAEDEHVRENPAKVDLPAGAKMRLGTLRFRHEMPIRAVVLSRDNKTAIAGDDSGFIICWDAATGREIRRIGARKIPIAALAISPDGKNLAAAGGLGLYVYNLATGKELAGEGIDLKDGAVRQVLFTPDGKTLILRSQNAIHVWDASSLKKMHVLKGHTGELTCMALSPNGKTLASGSREDPRIRMWDVAGGKEKLRFKAHDGAVSTVAFSADGKTLASTGNPASFAFFEAESGKKLRQIVGHGGRAQALVYSPDGKTLYTIENGAIQVRDAADGKPVRTFEAPSRRLVHLSVSADGTTIAAFGDWARAFDLWDAASGKRRWVGDGHQGVIYSLAFSADGRTLYTAPGPDEPALWWNVDSGELVGRFGDNPDGCGPLALSPDGKLLAVADSHTDTICLLDATNRKMVRVLKGHKAGPWWIAWSADGKRLASGSLYDRTVRLWDAGSGKEIRTIKTDLNDMAFSVDGKWLAATRQFDRAIRVWSADSGAEVRRISIPLPNRVRDPSIRIAFSPNAAILASGGGGGELFLWNAATGQLLRRWDTKADTIMRLAFSHDGRTLATAHAYGGIRLWEIATGQERIGFIGHRNTINALAFARDCRTLASGSYDTTVLVWDATGGRPKDRPSEQRLRTLWNDLKDADGSSAYRAIWQLAQSPREALPFLAERLPRRTPLDAQRQRTVDRLLRDLDGEQFAAREKAEKELEQMGLEVEPALRKGLEGKPSLEMRRRIELMLARLESEQRRALRALEAIEFMNAPEVRQLVDKLAERTPYPWLTEEECAIRKRLAKLSAATPQH